MLESIFVWHDNSKNILGKAFFDILIVFTTIDSDVKKLESTSKRGISFSLFKNEKKL